MDGLRGLLETIKLIRHRRPRPKFCPKCKSHNIKPVSILGILPMSYKCRDCGYEGSIVLEIDSE